MTHVSDSARHSPTRLTDGVIFRRRRSEGLPDGWRQLLDERSAQWPLLDDGDRDRLGELADWLLRSKRWEAARNFELTDEVRTVVAAHAVLPLLGLDERWYDEVGTIIVRAGAMERSELAKRRSRSDIEVIDGETHTGDGPLMISWRAARREALRLRLGRDVVIHEFAHKLDMLDGSLDGTPSAGGDLDLDEWRRICTNHFEAVREGSSVGVLRSYAATDTAEFFAVATETFFTRPQALRERADDLYQLFAGFYHQDPATRHDAAERRGITPAALHTAFTVTVRAPCDR